jgi:hypothetical protein
MMFFCSKGRDGDGSRGIERNGCLARSNTTGH